jgi:predicted GNAT family acetyltransferase
VRPYRYVFVEAPHPLCIAGDGQRYTWGALGRALNLLGTGDADEAVIAYQGDTPVGFFRYSCRHYNLHAHGTYVQVKHRGKGVAKRMWQLAIRRTSPVELTVDVISDGGMGVVRSVEREPWAPKMRIDDWREE